MLVFLKGMFILPVLRKVWLMAVWLFLRNLLTG